MIIRAWDFFKFTKKVLLHKNFNDQLDKIPRNPSETLKRTPKVLYEGASFLSCGTEPAHVLPLSPLAHPLKIEISENVFPVLSGTYALTPDQVFYFWSRKFTIHSSPRFARSPPGFIKWFTTGQISLLFEKFKVIRDEQRPDRSLQARSSAFSLSTQLLKGFHVYK